MRYSRFLKLLRSALVVALAAGLAACQGFIEGSASSSEDASIEVEVSVTTDTANGCWIVEFDAPEGLTLPEMDVSTIEDAIRIVDADGNLVSDSVTLSGGGSRAMVCAPCMYCSTYTASIIEGVIKDVEGNLLENLEIPEEFQEVELEMDDNPGDYDGDCYADFIVGDFTANHDDGIVRLYYGSATPSAGMDYAEHVPAEVQARLGGEIVYTDPLGVTVGGGPNLLVGMRTYTDVDDEGALFLDATAPGDPADLVPLLSVEGVDVNQRLGFRVGYLGDVDGDGYGDFAAAGRGATVPPQLDPQSSVKPRLFLGPWSSDGLATDADAILDTDFDPSNLNLTYKIKGNSDLDGEGPSEALVSAASVNVGTLEFNYKLFVYAGGSDFSEDVAPTTYIWGGGDDYNGMGFFFDMADVNGDGQDDLIAAAAEFEAVNLAPPDIKLNYGAVFIFFGPLSFDSAITPSDADVMISTDDEIMGFSVANMGDVNGDGIEDIMTTSLIAPNIPGYPDARAYLYLGRSDWEEEYDASDADLEITGVIDDVTESMDETIYAAAGLGDVDNDGYDDFIVGAVTKATGQASAYLFLGSDSFSSLPINLGLDDVTLVSPDGGSTFGLTAAAGVKGSYAECQYPLDDYEPDPEEPPNPKGGGDERLPE